MQASLFPELGAAIRPAPAAAAEQAELAAALSVAALAQAVVEARNG